MAGVANAAAAEHRPRASATKRQEKKLSLNGEWRKIISNARQWKLFTNCRSNLGDARSRSVQVARGRRRRPTRRREVERMKVNVPLLVLFMAAFNGVTLERAALIVSRAQRRPRENYKCEFSNLPLHGSVEAMRQVNTVHSVVRSRNCATATEGDKRRNHKILNGD